MTQMHTWETEYLTQIEDCEKRESRMSEWECTFIDSLRIWIEEGKRPTPRQVDTLDNIWSKVTKHG